MSIRDTMANQPIRPRKCALLRYAVISQRPDSDPVVSSLRLVTTEATI